MNMAASSSSSANYCCQTGLHVALILILFSLIYLPSKPVGLGFQSYGDQRVKEREKLVGSSPPACVNKCLNCRPCMATLVIQSHRQWSKTFFFKTTSPHEDHQEGDSYYLLSWKCKCGNKLFQP